MSNEAETIENPREYQIPLLWEENDLCPQINSSVLALPHENASQPLLPTLNYLQEPTENPSITQMLETRINLQPDHPKNYEPSYISKKEDKEEFIRIVETMGKVLNENPDIKLSHVIYMVREGQYNKVKEKITRNTYLVTQNSQDNIELFKSPKKILAGVSEWSKIWNIVQEQGYIWVFAVPNVLVESTFETMKALFNRDNLKSLYSKPDPENPFTLVLTRNGFRYAISLVPFNEMY